MRVDHKRCRDGSDDHEIASASEDEGMVEAVKLTISKLGRLAKNENFNKAVFVYDSPESYLPHIDLRKDISFAFLPTKDGHIWFVAKQMLALLRGSKLHTRNLDPFTMMPKLNEKQKTEMRDYRKRTGHEPVFYKKCFLESPFCVDKWKPHKTLIEKGLLKTYGGLDVLEGHEEKRREYQMPDKEWFVSYTLFGQKQNRNISLFLGHRGITVPDEIVNFCSGSDTRYTVRQSEFTYRAYENSET